MNGQIWEECECGKIPVCSQCFRCKIHCECEDNEIEKEGKN